MYSFFNPARTSRGTLSLEFACSMCIIFLHTLLPPSLDVVVPSFLSFPSDILSTPKPDERAIMTYVSCFYHAFAGAEQVLSFE